MSLNNKYTTIERVVAKIDNDFNPTDSDWIPRVAAWCIDALQQLRIMVTDKKKIKVTVNDRFAKVKCCLDVRNLRVYDENGCKVERVKQGERFGCCIFSMGGVDKSQIAELTPDTINLQNNKSKGSDTSIAYIDNTEKSWPGRYNVVERDYGNNPNETKKYLFVDGHTIEINWDTDYIFVEYDTVKTYKSDNYNTELPVIPNNGILLEALEMFCIYKMLCRGMKHPTMNLNASQYGTNPYYQWMQLKDKAKTETILDSQDSDAIDRSSQMFRSNFYINSYDPRRQG